VQGVHSSVNLKTVLLGRTDSESSCSLSTCAPEG
jgi:hypothetical protein